MKLDSCCIVCTDINSSVSEMAQWVKALTAKPDNHSLIPRTHRWKDRTDSHKLFFGLHIRAVTFTPSKINKYLHMCVGVAWALLPSTWWRE